MKIGLLPLGRETFDVPFASEKLAAMLAALDRTGHGVFGPRDLLFNADATHAAIADLGAADIDQLLVLQVTFTDAAMTSEAAMTLDVPMSIWAVPEPRNGGRLRLNSFCGLNLASHALGLRNRRFSWLYADPSTVGSADLEALLSGEKLAGKIEGVDASAHADDAGRAIAGRIKGKRIARIGEHPAGFDTCDYQPQALQDLAGVSVDPIALTDLFDTARTASPAATAQIMEQARAAVDGLDAVDPGQLDKSLRLKVGLDRLRETGGYDAFALRCWPETFTEYGGAICGPAALSGEARVPCACEADVYGALTQLILQEVAQAPVFLTDLVDMDAEDNTGVVWHCGQAPISMRSPKAAATATVHTNRKMPLLFEFPLKEGQITMMRISQAFGSPKMVIARARMLDRPMTFTGTSGVVRFERNSKAVLDDILSSGLEHHMALTYGDHLAMLRSVAAALSLPVLEL